MVSFIFTIHKKNLVFFLFKGLKPLIYSQKKWAEHGLGWTRTGHHISYYQNQEHKQNALVNRILENYYELDFQLVSKFIGLN